MGARTWMMVYAETDAREALKATPRLDRETTARLAQALFPGETLSPLEDGELYQTCPDPQEICIGCFPGVSVVAAREFQTDKPSTLARRFIDTGRSGTATLVGLYSVVDWFAYARWENGTLVRSLSLAPDFGVIEDIGTPMAFKEPYWAGQHPVVDEEDDDDDYPLPFHPLELGDIAMLALLGYQIEGHPKDFLFQPEDIALMRFERAETG